jgi:predicted amidohydrolase YtcJ
MTSKGIAVPLMCATLAGCGGAGGLAPGAGGEPADLVLENGNVVTMDAARPKATWVAVRGDRIVAVGTAGEAEAWKGEGTRVVDLAGRTVIPGIVEGHAHFLSTGAMRLDLDLTGTRSFEEVVARVAARVAATPPGGWIRGRGWHQDKWDRAPEPNVEGLPLHDALSAVSPENPVLLVHASGHSALVNARAMEIAGITAETPDPQGGEIVRDGEGRPTGALREEAEVLVARHFSRTAAEWEEVARVAGEISLSFGITSFQDAGSTFEEIALLKRLVDEGRLPVRLWVMIGEENDAIRAAEGGGKLVGYGDHRLTVGGIKRYIDGALGSHGAWLLAPYDDMPDSVGINVVPLEELEEAAELAAGNGLQLCTHAIGDRGVREMLDIYERVLARHPELEDHRWRIEHAQHVHPDDVSRFAKNGITASMQACHATSDGPWVPKRLGAERARERSYLLRTLSDSGALVINGTDSPVEPLDPFRNFHAAVTRKMEDGTPFIAGEALAREEALRAITVDAARAVFEEELKGSITPGRLADLAVLDRDLLTVHEDEIPATEVVMTIVGGEIAYER